MALYLMYGVCMASFEITLNNRYRAIYAIDERPGMRVLRCRDDQTGRLVLVAELLAASEEELRVLAKFATQIALVNHEVLLPLTDHFVSEGHYYLVCDDPGGQDLERTLRSRGGPLPEHDILQHIQRLLAGLEYLHTQRQPIYLGDPTSSDIWLRENGSWVFAPFTLVRPIGTAPSPYRAPELSIPGAEPTAVSDLYAIGALWYQALTGWPPPPADQLNAGTPLNSPRTLNPTITTLSEQALLRAMQLRAPNRYQTAREMRVALDTVHIMASRPATFAIDTAATVVAPIPVAVPPVAPFPPGYQPNYPPGQFLPPGYTPAYQPAPVPQQRGMSVGCIVSLAVVLTLILGLACLAVALFFTPLRSVIGLQSPNLPSVAVTAVAPEPTITPETTSTTAATPEPAALPPVATLEPIILGPNAITIDSAKAITLTREITTSQFGPVAYSPDGSLLAVAVSQQVSIRDTTTLNEVATFSGHTGSVTSLAWSFDSTLLATGASNDNNIRVWNVQSRQITYILTGHEGWIRSLAFAPSGTLLASGSTDLTVRIWDAQKGTLLNTLKGHTALIGGVVFTPDGKKLASASRDGSVRLWDVATGQERPEFSFQTDFAIPGQRFFTTGVSFSPDGKLLAVGATDAVVYILDAATGKEIRRLIGHTDWIVIRGVSFSPDGKQLYTAGLDASIHIWNPETGDELNVLDRHRLDVFSISVSPDNKSLVSVSDQEGSLLVWDLATGKVRDTLRVGQGVITSLAFAPENKTLGLVGYNGLIQLRRLSDDSIRPLPGAAGIFSPLAFLSADRFAAITDQGSVVIGSVSGSELTELTGSTIRPLTIAASRDGKLVAVGGEGGGVVIWDTATGKITATFSTASTVVTRLAFSYNSERLATVGPSNQPEIEIWDLKSGKQSQVLSGPTGQISGLDFQPGGTLIAATSIDGTLRLWDAETGLSVRKMDVVAGQGFFACVSFSPDGTMLATGARNGSLQLWDVRSGEEAAQYRLNSQIFAVGFSPDGSTLAVSIDGSVALFMRTAS
jgi:WD40 repeat protein/serine/threonine protein kinase